MTRSVSAKIATTLTSIDHLQVGALRLPLCLPPCQLPCLNLTRPLIHVPLRCGSSSRAKTRPMVTTWPKRCRSSLRLLKKTFSTNNTLVRVFSRSWNHSLVKLTKWLPRWPACWLICRFLKCATWCKTTKFCQRAFNKPLSSSIRCYRSSVLISLSKLWLRAKLEI